MNIIKTISGLAKHIHLNSTQLISGLTVSSFTVVCFSDTADISSTITITTSEITANHYVASVTFPAVGTYYLSITYGTYTEKYQVEVEREDISLLASKAGAANADFEVTVNDDLGAIVPGALVRVFNSSETRLLTKGTTSSTGKVMFSLGTGTYKARASKDGYSFSSVNPITLTVTASTTVNPVIQEFVPASVSASSTLCIRGLHFSSTTVAFVGGSQVSIGAVSTDGQVVTVAIPSTASSSISIQLGNPDASNPGTFLKSKVYNVLVT